MADKANNASYGPLDVALSLPQPSAPSPMDASSMQQLHFGPPETDARPQTEQSASSSAALPSQALQRLARHKTARLTPGAMQHHCLPCAKSMFIITLLRQMSVLDSLCNLG